MTPLRTIAACVSVVLPLLAAPASAQKVQYRAELETPMSFMLVASNPEAPPDKQQRWVRASGKIMPDTPQAFERFIAQTPISGLTVFFDSQGGSIGGGIRLGDALRKANATVAIGQSTAVGGPGEHGQLPRHQLSPANGRCFSSCAYSFLGGRIRQISSGAAYGVHMFWPKDLVDGLYDRNYSARDVEQAQRTSATIAIYLQRMGVDLKLLDLAVSTPIRAGIRRLTAREIVDLKVASLTFGAPVTAGEGNWGLSISTGTAALVTSGSWSAPDIKDVAYELRFFCGPSSGFDTVQYAETLREGPVTRAISMRRVVVASGEKDGVVVYSGKDGTALPARFNRINATKTGDRLVKTGVIMSEVLQNAVRAPKDGLVVTIDEGNATNDAGEMRKVQIKSGNMPALHGKWQETCAEYRKPKAKAKAR